MSKLDGDIQQFEMLSLRACADLCRAQSSPITKPWRELHAIASTKHAILRTTY
jgi:hypothetical protein